MIAVATAAVLSFAYIGVFRYWTPIDCEEFLPFKHRRDRVLKRFRDGRRVYAQTGTDMNFRRSLPEIRCAMIYWTTTIPHHNGPPPDPFQEMHAGCESCELLGDVHQVQVRPICTSLLALGPILFTQAESLLRKISAAARRSEMDHLPSGVNRPKPDQRAFNFPQGDFRTTGRRTPGRLDNCIRKRLRVRHPARHGRPPACLFGTITMGCRSAPILPISPFRPPLRRSRSITSRTSSIGRRRFHY